MVYQYRKGGTEETEAYKSLHPSIDIRPTALLHARALKGFELIILHVVV